MANIPPDKLRIGRSLLAGGPITQELLQRELDASGKAASVLGKALMQSGFPREEDLIVPILARLRIPKINAKNTKIPLETIRLIPEAVAKRARALAIDQIGGILVVVTPDLGNEEGLAEVRKATGALVTPIQCAPDGFDQIVQEYYQRLSEAGMTAAAPVTLAGAPAGGSGSGTHAVPGTNGVLKAIPAAPDDAQDDFWKRYMSSGPVPVEEAQM